MKKRNKQNEFCLEPLNTKSPGNPCFNVLWPSPLYLRLGTWAESQDVLVLFYPEETQTQNKKTTTKKDNLQIIIP